MRFVSKPVCFQIALLWMLLFQAPIFAQKNSDKLRKEQERIEKSIANTRSLLDKTQESSKATLNELKLIDNQVKYREELLLNYENQIRGAELKIEEKNAQIIRLNEKLIKLKEQYKKLLIYAYKHRGNQSKLMFIFSADSYYEAIKRTAYLKKIAEIQEKQRLIILQHQGLISEEKKSLETESQRKKRVAEEKRMEREKILRDKGKQEKVFQQLKGQEQKFTAELRENEKKKEVLKRKIKEAIDREIAAEEKARKERERKEKEALAKAEAARKKADAAKNPMNTDAVKTEPKTPVADKVEPVKKEVDLVDSKELALNKSFETNKGRLPWPLEKGSITEGYGKHAHPTLPGVFTNNNGIDISAPKAAQVRSVFEGEVTSVFNIPGAGKVVIIKHGNYRTVYSNLQEVYVSIGTKVNTKQRIGSLLTEEGESLSVAHFEIHQVAGDQVIRLNPSVWVAQ